MTDTKNNPDLMGIVEPLDSDPPRYAPSLTSEERKVLVAYRSASTGRKESVRLLLGVEVKQKAGEEGCRILSPILK